MTTRKRNEWLDAEDESDERDGYSSDEQRQGRSAVGRAAKRRRGSSVDSDGASSIAEDSAVHQLQEKARKVNSDDDEDNEDDDDTHDTSAHKRSLRDTTELEHLLRLKDALPESRFNIAAFEDEDDYEDNDDELNENHKPISHPRLPKISKTSAANAEKAARRTGVLYLSRIPPFMKPSTLRSLLTPYGTLNRIFLTPESATAHTSRVRSGGNKKKSYTDGWVEFVDKRQAKTCAALLNGRPVGGRGWYRDDVWVMKYLKGFKWRDLTGQLAEENAERAARVRAEVARGAKESKRFVDGVERGKMLQAMERRRGGLEQEDDGDDDGFGGVALDDAPDAGRGTEVPSDMTVDRRQKARRARKSFFKQNEVREKLDKVEPVNQPNEVTRVLSKIF